MGDTTVLVVAVAAAGAIAAGATAMSRPFVSLGILFFLASLSRVTLDTPIGTMRLEQPAIAVVALVLLAGGRFRILRGLSRPTLGIVLGFATYLGVLAISSALNAPDKGVSLRLVAWFAISMVGGIVAFVLIRSQPANAVEPLAIVGGVTGATGIAAAVAFLVAGPGFDLGIQESNGILPRVQAFAWEANLYASLLAISVPFALEATRGRRPALGIVVLVLVLLGLPLGLTRGAYLGLAAGIGVYTVIRLRWDRRPASLARLAAITAATLVVGIAATNVLLPNLIQRAAADAHQIVHVTAPPGSGGPGPSGGPKATPTPIPTPTVTLRPYPDTVSFRLERVPTAIDDLRHSPLIGLGAESFGQRHGDPSQGGLPDHIAILAVAAPYEAGIVGAGGLALAFILLLYSLWRSVRAASRSGDIRTVGAVAAFAGSIIAMLVAYEATNAFHFAINWIVIGCAVALGSRRSAEQSEGPLSAP